MALPLSHASDVCKDLLSFQNRLPCRGRCNAIISWAEQQWSRASWLAPSTSPHAQHAQNPTYAQRLLGAVCSSHPKPKGCPGKQLHHSDFEKIQCRILRQIDPQPASKATRSQPTLECRASWRHSGLLNLEILFDCQGHSLFDPVIAGGREMSTEEVWRFGFRSFGFGAVDFEIALPSCRELCESGRNRRLSILGP